MYLTWEDMMICYSRVKFLNKNGTEWQRKKAKEEGLIEGKIYDVDNTYVGDWETYLILFGIHGIHNSVMFEGVKGSEI
jgi:hypothetical protein